MAKTTVLKLGTKMRVIDTSETERDKALDMAENMLAEGDSIEHILSLINADEEMITRAEVLEMADFAKSLD